MTDHTTSVVPLTATSTCTVSSVRISDPFTFNTSNFHALVIRMVKNLYTKENGKLISNASYENVRNLLLVVSNFSDAESDGGRFTVFFRSASNKAHVVLSYSFTMSLVN